MKPSEVLAKAADLIEPEGMWTTDHSWEGQTGDHREGFCIFDAILKAHPQGKMINGWMTVRQARFADPASTLLMHDGAEIYGRSIDASWRTMKAPACGALGLYLYRAIGDDLEGYPTGLVRWNDEEGRTQAEVVAALRKAASLAKADGR